MSQPRTKYTEAWYYEQVAKKHAKVQGGVDVTRRLADPVAVPSKNPKGRCVDNGERTKVAGSNLSHAPYSPYKNKLEYTFAAKLELQKKIGAIRNWGYETQTFMLSKGAKGQRGDYHRNDFVIQHLDGSIEMAQTKGWHKNIAASMKGLRWAAQKHPWYTWTIWRYRNGWEQEEIQP